MFNSLKKLFSGKPEHAGTPASKAMQSTAENTQFLRREAVFDRNNRLSGHLFTLHESTALADADDARQRSLDETLLATLNTSADAWNTSHAFIPLSSASLDLPAVDRLKTSNIVLLLQLAADTEADIVCEAIDRLHERGLCILPPQHKQLVLRVLPRH